MPVSREQDNSLVESNAQVRFTALQSFNIDKLKLEECIMLPSIYGENMLDDFFGTSFFGGHDPLFGKHGRNLMKTDIR